MRSHQDLRRLQRDQIGLSRFLFLLNTCFIVAVQPRDKTINLRQNCKLWPTYRDIKNSCNEPANKIAKPQSNVKKINFRVLINDQATGDLRLFRPK